MARDRRNEDLLLGKRFTICEFIVGVTLGPMYAGRILGTFSDLLAIGESCPLRARTVAAPSGGAEFDR